MAITTIISAGILGFIVSALATFAGKVLGKRVSILHWIVNILLGILGSVAATQLLPGAYGPTVFGVTLIPSIVGSLVLAGIGTWTINRYTN